MAFNPVQQMRRGINVKPLELSDGIIEGFTLGVVSRRANLPISSNLRQKIFYFKRTLSLNNTQMYYLLINEE